MRNSSVACELFRVSTSEILEELKTRSYFKVTHNLKEFSSKELLDFIMSERINSFVQ